MRPNKIHIQHQLNVIQHECGYLPDDRLKALSLMAQSQGERLPLHRLHEVASFFLHYRLDAPAGTEVKVCRDMACHLRGASRWRARLEQLAARLGDGRLKVEGVSCLGQCDRAPAFVIVHNAVPGAAPRYHDGAAAPAVIEAIIRGVALEACEELVRCAVEDGVITAPPRPDPESPPDWKIDVYRGHAVEPYQAARKLALSLDAAGPGAAAALIEALKVADLRGMGGAGAPAHQKWKDVQEARLNERIDAKYIVCNGDESEPGTFKDRELLLQTPHLVVEGVILAGLVTGASKGYLYIRHEYRDQIDAVRQEIKKAENAGACGDNLFGTGRSFPVEVYVSPGGYICGEQSALIEAMEDKRAEPRNKPPELATNGLWDMPTLVSNVETFAWAPSIALRGGEWYRDQGAHGSRGRRFFSVCGDVTSPGVYEVPIGLPLGELIALAGGLRDGKSLKAVATSGPSGGFVPARVPIPEKLRLPKSFPLERVRHGATEREILDMELDIDVFRAFGLMLGAGIVVYAEGSDMTDHALNCSEFYRNESCGKCVPCRQGSERMVQLAIEVRSGTADSARLEEIEEWVDNLREALQQTSICGLGAVAAEPLGSTFQFFRDDIERHARRDVPPDVFEAAR